MFVLRHGSWIMDINVFCLQSFSKLSILANNNNVCQVEHTLYTVYSAMHTSKFKCGKSDFNLKQNQSVFAGIWVKLIVHFNLNSR